MKTTPPNLLFIGGIQALAFSNFCKEQFPDTLGHVLPLHWGCAIVSAVCFSVGLLLSLRGLLAAEAKRYRFLLPALCNVLAFAGVLCMYYYASFAMAKMLRFAEEEPNHLTPRLIEYVQTGNSEEKRRKVAEALYETHGWTLAYRRDDGSFQPYEPTDQDDKALARQRQSDGQIQRSIAQIQGALDQWPYLFAFYVGAFLITFIVGAILFGCKSPTPSAPN